MTRDPDLMSRWPTIQEVIRNNAGRIYRHINGISDDLEYKSSDKAEMKILERSRNRNLWGEIAVFRDSGLPLDLLERQERISALEHRTRGSWCVKPLWS